MYYMTFDNFIFFHRVSEAESTQSLTSYWELLYCLSNGPNTNFFYIRWLSPYIFDGLEDILHSQWDDPWCAAVPHHSKCLPR